jgi:hypothetical protein
MLRINRLKLAVYIVAVAVLAICVYCFVLGNDVLKGKFANESIAWYFLAKGLFCSVALYLLVNILEVLRNNKS